MTTHHRFPPASSTSPPQLRLFSPRPDLEPSAGDLTPASKLRDFVRIWYTPQVLDSPRRKRPASQSTRQLIAEMLAWWESLTPNPGIGEPLTPIVDSFAAALTKATYKRGPLGKDRPLSEANQAKHLRHLRGVLLALPGCGLVPDAPLCVVHDPELLPKLTFTIEQVRAIAAAAQRLAQEGLPDVEPLALWPARVAVLFYTGLRIGDVEELRWTNIRSQGGASFLELKSRGERKTGKRRRIALHPQASGALAPLRPFDPGLDEKIFGRPNNYSALRREHRQLLEAAGIPPAQEFGETSFNCWRRTHDEQIGLAGLTMVRTVTQSALAHASANTTASSYCDAANLVRPLLPAIFE